MQLVYVFSMVIAKQANEEYETMGYIGVSTGKFPTLLLVPRSDSFGGVGIPLSQVIRITIDKQNIYKCANYQLPQLKMRKVANFTVVYRLDITTNKWRHHARFSDKQQAERYVKFLLGESNRK